MKKLIHNIRYKELDTFEQIKHSFSDFIKISVFFDNANFLITKYTPLSSSVHMILEDSENNELHIEDANCGYNGSGPNAAADFLKSIGIKNDISELRNLIFFNDALQFSLQNSEIIHSSIDTSLCFHSLIRSYDSKIPLDGNVYIDITKRKIIFINPQYHCFLGLVNYLKKINISEFEYYIGENSPLENRLNLNSLLNVQFNFETPDLTGIKHVNLSLRNQNTNISCLIDKSNEIQIIDAIYLALNNNTLFSTEKYDIKIKPKNKFQILFDELFPQTSNKNIVLHDTIILNSEDRK